VQVTPVLYAQQAVEITAGPVYEYRIGRNARKNNAAGCCSAYVGFKAFCVSSGGDMHRTSRRGTITGLLDRPPCGECGSTCIAVVTQQSINVQMTLALAYACG